MAANTRDAVCSALPSSSTSFNKKKAPVGSFSKYCENYREIWLDCNGGVQVPRGDLLPRHQGEVPVTVLYCTVLYCTVLYCTALYCTAGGGPVTGRVWPLDPVYFPDYTLPRAQRWWQQMVEEFHDLIE